MSFFAVIMAGGVGKRFWPQSRRATPKQLLPIAGDESMLRMTVDRLKNFTTADQILIITNSDQEKVIRQECPELPEENILIEPEGKNTAPAIGLAAIIIQDRDPDAVMGVFPADHYIQDVKSFSEYMQQGIKIANEMRGLVTFGVVPTRPATGYGYIQFHDRTNPDEPIFAVKAFAEKPDLKTAELFLGSGDFLWNSGMFVWRVDSILKSFQEFLPEIWDSLENIRGAIGKPVWDSVLTVEWATLRSISIDYGVMEKARNVYVVRVDFSWNDVGSWDAVHEMRKKDKDKNVSKGEVIFHGSENNLVFAEGKTVAIVGVDDLVVIDTKDALLIIPRGQTERVKELVDGFEKEKRNSLL
ncbi:MAG: NTP transferase domain-containing protein [Candidatus Marinimicrobia bacterium]|jgi:mannose-1-phosphate guanylyltransferase|nr:NTP transferase domain-containing protein [Candidatus Neomarinimicrobiota bacterium]MBT4715294.1 NTP transferase domain-containing protein [Candidatus Neomarinimicrobiota bacterium]MBT4946956.1 NTP transferase domain-containing protein [Candidatus Neomarinimicrobiota bacterium]MBT5271364.1 NTP transferase domain-containing protein [Candidatus Neomarinimicrobiota bacterium]MBT6011205.1 NTP transferase domain-containing protein [Candidatus Neomarinimicrobiota bacterium]